MTKSFASAAVVARGAPDPTRPYPWAAIAWGALPRFFDKVEVSAEPAPEGCVGPCHLWTGAKSRGKGNLAWYGSFRVGRWAVRAHIFVAVVQGKMRPGHHVDHLCRNTLCVNGDHLEVVTPTVNSERRWAAARGEVRRRVGWLQRLVAKLAGGA